MAAQLLVGGVLVHRGDARDPRVVLEIDDDARRRRGRAAGRPAASAASPGGRLALRRHGRSVVNASSTACSSSRACSAVRSMLPGAGRGAAMARDAPPGGGEDLQVQLAEAGA